MLNGPQIFQTMISVWNITGLYGQVAKIRFENLSLWQKLNSFNNATHDSFPCYCMYNQLWWSSLSIIIAISPFKEVSR